MANGRLVPSERVRARDMVYMSIERRGMAGLSRASEYDPDAIVDERPICTTMPDYG